MKIKLLSIMDKLLLCKRALIETVNDQLEDISQIGHAPPERHQLLGQSGRRIDRLYVPS
jgi:hypothetical protein